MSIGTGSDDAYETPTGWPYFNSSSARVYSGAPYSSGPTWGGWRWAGLGIPAGAQITEAYVEFYLVSSTGNGVSTTLSFENTSYTSPFYSWLTPYDRWSRRTVFEVKQMWGYASYGTWQKSVSLVGGIQELVDRYRGLDNVVLLEGYTVTGVAGSPYLENISVRAPDGRQQELPVKGLFVELGLIPNSDLVKGLVELDEQGRVMVNCRGETSRPGIYAAGDVTDSYAEQVLIAIGDGAKAVLSAYEFLLRRHEPARTRM